MTRELFPNDSIRPPTTATPPSLSPRTPPSRPCTLADKKWEVLLASGVDCVRVALFKDERREVRRGDDDSRDERADSLKRYASEPC